MDNYFVRPDAGGPALELSQGISRMVLVTTVATGKTNPYVVLRPRHVEEACRAMYRMAGLDWPGGHEECHGEVCFQGSTPAPYPVEECAGTIGHAGEHTPNADDIPAEQEPPLYRDGTVNPAFVRSLYVRLSDLEQSAAIGAATDDIFANHARRIEALEQDTGLREDHMRLHEQLSHRLESLEQTYLDDTGTRDIIVQLLTEIRDRLPAPPPPACGEPNGYGATCSQPAGHVDRHRAGITTWPNVGPSVCGEVDTSGRWNCSLPAGHTDRHSSDTNGPLGVFTWPRR